MDLYIYIGPCLRVPNMLLASEDTKQKQNEQKGVAQSRHAFVGGTVSTWGR